MQLRFPQSEIETLAFRYGDSPVEDGLLKKRQGIQRAGFMSQMQLYDVCRWKSPRRAELAKNNKEEYVKEVTAWSFSTSDERAKIEVLTSLDGVGWPTASAILHLYHKDRYPILDFRALWSLRDRPRNYSFGFWWQYVECCRKLADENNVTMRELDRALWQYSYENQKQTSDAGGEL